MIYKTALMCHYITSLMPRLCFAPPRPSPFPHTHTHIAPSHLLFQFVSPEIFLQLSLELERKLLDNKLVVAGQRIWLYCVCVFLWYNRRIVCSVCACVCVCVAVSCYSAPLRRWAASCISGSPAAGSDWTIVINDITSPKCCCSKVVSRQGFLVLEVESSIKIIKISDTSQMEF